VTPFERQFDFSGKRALVTGAGNGIGEAIARAYAAQGAFVVLADRDAAALGKVADDLAGSCSAHVFDQSDIASIEALAAAAGSIDILVNNAGIAVRGPLLDLDWARLRNVVDINLVGPIALTRLVGATMVARGSGCVINISSQMAFTGARHRSAYAATKLALAQFTKTAALEWGEHGVRVNGIAPGRTVTAINREVFADPAEYAAGLVRIPLKRYGDPADMANAAVFLASPAASYITGQTLIIDGGWVLE
jgi:NAD(P)-dependent dehydrogenase (short-subunit alcohol dehydrogenase family)